MGVLQMSKTKESPNPGHLIPISSLVLIPPVIKKELQDAARRGEGTPFFRKFRLGDLILVFGQPKLAYDEGLRILNECRNADLKAFARVHKGGIYYWLGMASFLVRDYETAAFFFDAAVSEDLRQGSDPVTKSTPALRFIQVEGEADKQAARPLVELTQKKIESLIDVYNKTSGRPANAPILDMPAIRSRFLRPAVSSSREHWRSLATTFISFFIEWNDRNEFLDLRVGEGTAEPFFLHLFKGCVLFESLLKANPTNPPPDKTSSGRPLTLIGALQHVHEDLGVPNDLKIGDSYLPTIISELQDSDRTLTSAITFTGLLRNSVGHNLGWRVSLTKLTYQQLFTMIAVSNLHAISALY
jgi:hypothetical protein